ncbi:Hypothetical predicted protein [Mytilus galloprovincialis]|uniref:Uncharacterized protein n=1 Tax=Mytilus galloprovincialis TaxID=29158 RepID=A0A8B6FPM5_MYTGA|nr:Hypothetical predicted protein [Mytilus galloprovincialis]
MPSIHGVTCVDNDTVAVISASERNIHLVSLKSGKAVRIIKTNFFSHGLTFTEESFIVCPAQDQMQEVRLDNNTRCIGSNVLETYVASLGNALFFVKKDTHSVVCINKNGDILWTFTNDTDLSGPRCITVDEHGNTFVVGYNSNNVIAIDTSGKQHKILFIRNRLMW